MTTYDMAAKTYFFNPHVNSICYPSSHMPIIRYKRKVCFIVAEVGGGGVNHASFIIIIKLLHKPSINYRKR